jgi:predicted alpha/beta-fold hydrolase
MQPLSFSICRVLCEADDPGKCRPYRWAPPASGCGWLHLRRGLTNGHLQTIVGNYLPRPAFLVPASEDTVEVDPSNGSRVVCHCHWQPDPGMARRLTVVPVHGLEGSSESGYIKGVAARAWNAGCNVIRMNMRNCGGTDTLSPTLYHSGLSSGVGAVVRHYSHRFALERIALVGYSMGGNVVLKLAGEWGSEPPMVRSGSGARG